MEKATNAKPKIFNTPYGDIHYWVGRVEKGRRWLVFLPGLTADHHLFDKQTEALGEKYNYLVWDAPAHGQSRPFELKVTMNDMAQYLGAILEQENAVNPVLIGQSMGGYLSQVYTGLFPGKAAGFVSIDSAPMKKEYYSRLTLASLHHTKGMYLGIPWKLLKSWAALGLATTEYGRQLMRDTIEKYDKKQYCELAGYGFHIVAAAIEAGGEYKVDCPTLLICGENDRAGFVKRYCRKWAKNEGYELVWLPGAGHNANTDDPQRVNQLIDKFVSKLGNASR